jgi:hypothetical protein
MDKIRALVNEGKSNAEIINAVKTSDNQKEIQSIRVQLVQARKTLGNKSNVNTVNTVNNDGASDNINKVNGDSENPSTDSDNDSANTNNNSTSENNNLGISKESVNNKTPVVETGSANPKSSIPSLPDPNNADFGINITNTKVPQEASKLAKTSNELANKSEWELIDSELIGEAGVSVVNTVFTVGMHDPLEPDEASKQRKAWGIVMKKRIAWLVPYADIVNLALVIVTQTIKRILRIKPRKKSKEKAKAKE